MARRVALIDLLAARYPDRERRVLYAQVLRGEVTVDGAPVLKPGAPVPAEAAVAVRALPTFVSRGGEKLAAALAAWKVECRGVVWLDAGCSTGGFTDCLLQNGASLVHAVDVGEGQLHWQLRQDPRVHLLEGTNVMDLVPGSLTPPPSRAVADLSFRSLRRAARHVLDLTAERRGIFLVKPQFEMVTAPPEFHGVVKGAGALRSILESLCADLAAEEVAVAAIMRSPLRGAKGNREFLAEMVLRGACATACALPEDLFLE